MAMLGAITKGEGINRKRCPVCGELEASMLINAHGMCFNCRNKENKEDEITVELSDVTVFLQHVKDYKELFENYVEEYNYVKNNKTKENKILYFSKIRPEYIRRRKEIEKEISFFLNKFRSIKK